MAQVQHPALHHQFVRTPAAVGMHAKEGRTCCRNLVTSCTLSEEPASEMQSKGASEVMCECCLNFKKGHLLCQFAMTFFHNSLNAFFL